MSDSNNSKKRLKMDVDQSIANKLKKEIQLVSGFALLGATLLFVCLDILSYRQNMMQNTTALANVVSNNITAAIVFDDAMVATKLITSLLEESMISGAVIYKPDWQEFVSTPMEESTRLNINDENEWRISAADTGVIQHRMTFTELNVLKPIYLHGELIAYLFIEGSLTLLYKKLITDMIFIAFIWMFIMFFVYIFSKNLHQSITGPIESLIAGMHKVSQDHDFNVQLAVVTDDEIGVITDSFNDMLGEVQLRDFRLDKYRNELEDIVDIRTHDLEVAVADAIKSKKIAELANHAKSEFLATMSHEIRTPMNGVLGMVDMMMRTELTDKQKKYISVIHKSGELLLILLNDILDFSKIESGQLELENVVFNAGDLVDEVIDMMQVNAKNKGLELTVNISSSARCIVSGDSTRVTQILVNLISNAIKFTEAGHVQVSVDLKDPHNDKEIFEFKVSDTGIGIEDEKQKLIFDAFIQADGSMTRKYGGTGLGLAITKKLVGLMRGTIEVDSKPGVGSVFTVSLPLQAEHMTSKKDNVIPTKTHNNEQQSNGRILLAEDNEMNQEVAVDMIESMGYSVDVANNGEEAVHMSQQNRYDIVLMDCQMPVKNGLEAAKEIRQLEISPDNHNIIVALTGNALNGDKAECIESGMDDFLSKPYKYVDLEKMLKKWIQ